MEFNEKLQILRKKKGLTQAQLAEALHVSRTAVSKWESGRGYPGIDTLQAIGRYFCVPVDDLLSDGVLPVATGQTVHHHLRFGLLDLSAMLLLFLPLLGQQADGAVEAVSLLGLTAAAPYLRGAYLLAVSALAAAGVLTLILRDSSTFWKKYGRGVSLFLNGGAALLFVVGSQPYAATVMLLYLALKAFWLLKTR